MNINDRKDTPRNIPDGPATLAADLLIILEKHAVTRSDLFKTCISCFEWREGLEECQKFKQRPPAKVIANGCEYYADLPF
jgi:hypothetical protein